MHETELLTKQIKKMKYVFSLLMILHGIIHLMGFTKAFKLAQIEQLTSSIPKVSGLLWLLAFLLFLASTVAYLTKVDWWYVFAFIAVLASSILIISVWNDAKFGTIVNVIILAVAIIGYGTFTFRASYEKDVIKGLLKTDTIKESLITEKDIQHLPEAVKKYIRYTGFIGKPKIHNFRLEFTGQIRKNDQSEWMPLNSVQYNFLSAPSRLFFMDAQMKKLPVVGYHSFIKGKAFMDIRLFSLFKVQYQSGEVMDISETVTFFNDMCCMAPGTLIDDRIKWTIIDSTSVKAEFTLNNITISADLYFNEKGELINFISNDRYAAGENGKMEKLPWSTPIKDYKEVDGYTLGRYADAIYTYDEGDMIYGSFVQKELEFNCKELR